jgi:rare lipoprotein A
VSRYAALAFVALSLAMTAEGLDWVEAEATWYGRQGAALQTANGDRFDEMRPACACDWLPFGTVVRITYKGRSLDLVVNDRYNQDHPGNQGWRVDVTKGAAAYLGFLEDGRVKVRLEVVYLP